jgi:hypothetical protein
MFKGIIKRILSEKFVPKVAIAFRIYFFLHGSISRKTTLNNAVFDV